MQETGAAVRLELVFTGLGHPLMNPHSVPLLVALTEGANIPLDKPIVLIGRHQECDIQIPSRKISRRHCLLAQVNDHIAVRDLGSTNGIRINGVKVLEGNLHSNDELMIGNMSYRIHWGDDEPNGVKNPPLENAIKAMPPVAISTPRHEESCEVPMALPDMSLSKPVMQAIPIVNGKPVSGIPQAKPILEIPDDPQLIPLEPPQH